MSETSRASVAHSHPPRLDEITRIQARELADADAIVLMPLGATEQHGPHLPAGTDSLAAEAVAMAGAALLPPSIPILVAPTLPYGSSNSHLPFGATASITPRTYLGLLVELGASLASSGFKRLFFLNGHGGNHYLAHAAAQDLTLRHDVHTACASWWLLAAEGLERDRRPPDGPLPGHAGAFETSIVLALAPDQVAASLPHRTGPHPRITAFTRALAIELPDRWTPIDGWTDDPSSASQECGRRYLDIAAEALAEAIHEFADQTARPGAR